jgi:hypothetical protein
VKETRRHDTTLRAQSGQSTTGATKYKAFYCEAVMH